MTRRVVCSGRAGGWRTRIQGGSTVPDDPTRNGEKGAVARGRCPVCGRSVLLNKAGEIRRHKTRTNHHGLRCGGSLSDPEPSILVTEEALGVGDRVLVDIAPRWAEPATIIGVHGHMATVQLDRLIEPPEGGFMRVVDRETVTLERLTDGPTRVDSRPSNG